MAKQIIKKDPYDIEVGVRLKTIIDAYYSNQKDFAEIHGLDNSTISKYINGTLSLSSKTADLLQLRANINRDYLFNGDLPMLLDDTIKPIKQHLVEKTINATIKGTHQKEQELAKAKRGRIPQFAMTRRGIRSVLSMSGEMDIVDTSINGIKEPFGVHITDSEFCERYNKFNLSLGCHLYIDNEINDGDPVLVYDDREHYICVYDNGIYYEAINKEQLNVENSDVIGAIYSYESKFEIK